MKILFYLLIGVATPSFASNNAISCQMSKKSSFIKINITLVSKQGCKFKIVGDYNTWTGTFTGTVTASGSSPCPTGTYTFGLVIHDDGTSEVSGDNEFTRILLSEPETLNSLINQIQAAN